MVYFIGQDFSTRNQVHMISNTSGKKISIYITTYKPDFRWKKDLEMDKRNNKKTCRAKNNFCSICLKSKFEQRDGDYYKFVTQSCPICQKNCDYCHNSTKDKEICDKTTLENFRNVKDVQTSDTNVTQGLNLLNEVLTVFQKKKGDINKDKIKPVHSKDVAVSTDNTKDSSRLTISKFHYSIEDRKKPEIGAFVIVNSFQPDYIRKSQYSIDLIKHKSSSIPQMKLEELKYSVKEKSKSKDAIEEVNRMFATVRKTDKYIENSNRPMVRNGPRVLPVVKNMVGQDTMSAHMENVEKNPCTCCQTCMSSGDSFTKLECGHDVNNSNHDRNVYMLCCHYQNKQKMQAGMLTCDHCRSSKDNYRCEHENYDDC
ncbi:unnamed protein product [Arctia plantaginis]|uniref:Uncharacterized protein n=1 Tax=Arctia plantaginis TaxID=874455 RepID=A0A8S1A6D5_ARCPL|nr:unnamed protein product [Arctia plantaginis]